VPHPAHPRAQLSPHPPRVTLNASYPEPVPLDQLLVQYYFNGPEDLQTSGTGGAAPAKGLSPQAAAELAGAQFRASCTDASPAVGEAGGLPCWGRVQGRRPRVLQEAAAVRPRSPRPAAANAAAAPPHPSLAPRLR
jgi:hypothetical protein